MNPDDAQLNLPEREEKILKFWEENQIFEGTLAKTKKGKPFVFYEGPPFANGHPGIHHVEARAFKDVILRFKTMQGYFVPRRAGWDTHGLPVELQVEKELGLKNKRDIERYGIALFNQKCRESVWKYKEEWQEMTKRIGFWLDFKNAYITYENQYIESLWAIIKKFWDKKNLYQDYKIIPWCSRCGTGLSSHELGQPGAYRQTKDSSIFVKFKLKGKHNEYLLVWTTTPWTLPGNVAVAVNSSIEYGKYKIGNEYVWSAVSLSPLVTKESPVENIKGKALIGLEYEPLYPAPSALLGINKNISYKILGGDFVTTEDGTGIVHIAPAFGEDDMAVVKKEYGEKYPILLTVNTEGKMEKGVIGGELFVKDADKIIIEDLEKRNLIFKKVLYEHDYPHCWRCDTPLIYLARKSWWVKKPVTELLKENKKINWVPNYLKEGRMREWLAEKKDWAFSRERYWGTPIPIWQCESCRHIDVIGSIDEMLKKTKTSKNKYFIMRHGESEANMLRIISSEPNIYHLTERGEKQVLTTAKKLKKEKIDIIMSSDILRTRETAEIVRGVLGIHTIHLDPRAREIQLGNLSGKSSESYHRAFPTYKEKFSKRPEGGESLQDLRARMVGFIQDIDEKYSGKNILIVSHEYPLWLLWSAGQGMPAKDIIAIKEKIKGADFIKTGEYLKFPFKKLPYSHKGTVDLHRPFIDSIKLECSRCDGEMARVTEVCDVWFDSGAMPFAQNHWQGIGKPKAFPADFISEGVDQTRGWFYTLLAVSTLLGYGTPYKNVLSLGHVLDKNGQKMSKSKENVVEPGSMIQKYGVDSLRWYFYTINSPDDTKAFDEKDVLQRLRGFINTFWNSYLLFETYAPKKISLKNISVKNILDRWILSRLQSVIAAVTKHLNAYEPVSAARALEEFLVSDFSQWFLRRSRRRFQKPVNKKELDKVSEVSAYVLLTITKLSAPFVPFLTEIIFQRLRQKIGVRELSIHLAEWPKENKKFKVTSDFEVQMDKIRMWAALALQMRAKAGIKVRQPLAEFVVNKNDYGKKEKFSQELLEILKDEINVKKISWGNECTLDTRITPELREEGFVREVIRNIQEMRKDAGFKPGDGILVSFSVSSSIQTVLEKRVVFMLQEIGAKSIHFGGKQKITVERIIETEDTHEKITIGIVKII